MNADGTVQYQASPGRATRCSRQGTAANGSFAAAGRGEGIEHADIAAGEVGDVAGDQDQTPCPGRSSQEAVDDGERVGDVQVPPFLRNASIDVDDVIGVDGPQAV